MSYNVTTVGIVGSGLMGTGIAEVSTLAGFPTTLVKATTPHSYNPQTARDRVAASMAKRVDRGKLDSEAMDRAMTKLTVTCDRDSLANADLVLESIVEDLNEKRALFSDLAGRLNGNTAFASNTSTLRIRDLCPAGYENRTIGLHFFSPVPAMSLVEWPQPLDRARGKAAEVEGFVSQGPHEVWHGDCLPLFTRESTIARSGGGPQGRTIRQLNGHSIVIIGSSL